MPCTGKVWSKENSHRNAGEKVSYITTLENAISAEGNKVNHNKMSYSSILQASFMHGWKH